LINHKIINLKFKLFLLILFISGVLSQTKHEPFSTEKEGKVYYIKAVSEAPSIDGVLDDAIWSSILPITDFIQEEPDNMAEPTQNTEVYITYDDHAFYVAARLYDSEPSDITRQLAPRDDWYGAFDEMADWFRIDLDSRHDHQTAFSFAVNASGVLSDEMIYNDEDIDSDWNAIWQAEIQIDEQGWTIEMEIPFSNLPFYKGKNQTWGLNITRFIQRNYERINWVTFPMDVEGVASKYGHVTGFEGIYPPAKLKFVANFFGSTAMYDDLKLLKSLGKSYKPRDHKGYHFNDREANLGVDITYRINPSSQVLLTINPIFDHVESDPAYVNNTSFETYFKEKRTLFLKDADIFKTPLEIFYSRRIGDSDWQTVIVDKTKCSFCEDIDTTYDYITIPYNIKTAGKWTGKTIKGLSYGLLGAITTPTFPHRDSTLYPDNNDWDTQMEKMKDKNYLVGRIKQDLFSGNSYIGFMSTSHMENSAHTMSVDGMANFFDNQIGLNSQILMTANEHKGIYSGVSFSPPGIVSGWIDYYYYDRGLNIDDLGYLWRDDYTKTQLGLIFQSYEPWNMVRQTTFILQGDIEENLDGMNLGKSIELSYDMKFTKFWSIGGGFKQYMDAYDDRKIFTNVDIDCCPSIFLPEVNEYHIELLTDQHKSFSSVISLMWQKSSINDTYMDQYIEITYKPNSYLQFSTSYDYQRVLVQNHFLEAFYEKKIDSSFHYIFSMREGNMSALTFRTTANINRKLSFQGYLELFSNHDLYSEYVEYIPLTNEYDDSTAFILGLYPFIVPQNNEEGEPNEYAGYPMEVYTSSTDLIDLAYSYVDPNNELDFAPKLTSFRLNGVLRWNYMKGSNLYIVYSANKNINGLKFDNISQLRDFITFSDDEPWVEILTDHTFMIKIDYWFEK